MKDLEDIVKQLYENQAITHKALLSLSAEINKRNSERAGDGPKDKQLGLQIVLAHTETATSRKCLIPYRAHIGIVTQLKDGTFHMKHRASTIYSGFITPEFFEKMAIGGPSVFENAYGWKWGDWFQMYEHFNYTKEAILHAYECNMENWREVYGEYY